MTRNDSAVLPAAYVALRIVIVLNWVFGACIIALLAYTFVNAPWTMKALGISRAPDASIVLRGMRSVAALGALGILLHYALLKRLLAIVETVQHGDPFVTTNAARLQTIAWVLLALQILSVIIGGIGKAISTSAHPIHLSAGFSTSGWLAVILTFVLARVFAEGALMREELEGTV